MTIQAIETEASSEVEAPKSREEAILEQYGLLAPKGVEASLREEEREAEAAAIAGDPDILPRLGQIARRFYFAELHQKGQSREVVRSGIEDLRGQIWRKLAESSHPVNNATNERFLTQAARAVISSDKRAARRVWHILEQKASRTDKTGMLRSWDKLSHADQAVLCARMTTYGVITPESAEEPIWTQERTYDAEGRLVSIGPKVLVPRRLDTSAVTVEKVQACLATHTTLNDRNRINPAIWSQAWPKVDKSFEEVEADIRQNEDVPDKVLLMLDEGEILGNRTFPLEKGKDGILHKQKIVDIRLGKTGNLSSPFIPPYDAKMGRVQRNNDLMEHTVHISHTAETVMIQEVWDFFLQVLLWEYLPLQFFVRRENFASNGKKGDKKDVRSKGSLNWVEAVKLALYSQPVQLGEVGDLPPSVRKTTSEIKWSAPPEPDDLDKETKRHKQDRENSPGTWEVTPGPDDSFGFTRSGYDGAKALLKKRIGQKARLVVKGSKEVFVGEAVDMADEYLKGTNTLELVRSYIEAGSVALGLPTEMVTIVSEVDKWAKVGQTVRYVPTTAQKPTKAAKHYPRMMLDEPPRPTVSEAKAALRTARTKSTKAYNKYINAEGGDNLDELRQNAQDARKAAEKAFEALLDIS